MRRVWAVALVLLMLCGCGEKNRELDKAMQFRDELLNAEKCAFDAEITADYAEEIHIFSMTVVSDGKGDVSFRVSQPEVISGIEGTIYQSQAALTFDDTLLAFPMLAEGQLAPVAAPWVLLKALRSGYISSVCKEGEGNRLTLLDSFEDDSLLLDVWFNTDWIPVRGEILYKGEKILTLLLENFTIV